MASAPALAEARKPEGEGKKVSRRDDPTAWWRQALSNDANLRPIAEVLPDHIPVDRFKRVLLNAIIQDPKLMRADPASLLKEAAGLASLGLYTDPQLGEAALLADSTGKVQRRVMVRGLCKLARQTGEIARVYAREVCKHDHIRIAYGLDDTIEHDIPIEGDRGEVIGFYAVVRYKDGTHDFEFMRRDAVERIRDKSSDSYKAWKAGKIKTTPWEEQFEEMGKKTVVRRLMKRIPQSPDLQDAIQHENRLDSEQRQDVGGGPVIDMHATTVEEEPEGEEDHDPAEGREKEHVGRPISDPKEPAGAQQDEAEQQPGQETDELEAAHDAIPDDPSGLEEPGEDQEQEKPKAQARKRAPEPELEETPQSTGGLFKRA